MNTRLSPAGMALLEIDCALDEAGGAPSQRALSERVTELIVQRDLLKQELEQANIRLRTLEAAETFEGNDSDRTMIDMDTLIADGKHELVHVSPNDAYASIETFQLFDATSWLCLTKHERCDVAREWCHVNRAARLELLDVAYLERIGNMDNSHVNVAKLVRVLVALLWESNAGSERAQGTIEQLFEEILSSVPDFYLFA